VRGKGVVIVVAAVVVAVAGVVVVKVGLHGDIC
jgi:hypothetical protein